MSDPVLAPTGAAAGPAATLRALLERAVDYAGLFPPAALDMERAVRQYAAHRRSPARWLLGRFVLPAARLDEFAVAAERHRQLAEPWRLSALVGPDTEDDLARVAQFNAAAGRGDPTVDTVEGRAATPAGIAGLAARVPRSLTAYVELPATADPAPLAAACAAARVRAKLRTGGVTADAFPPAVVVTRFLAACASAGLPCKLTAGLHHALRGDYRLTYADDSPSGAMLGFVNVFAAALLLHAGLPPAEAERVLAEDDPSAFAFDDAELRWRDHVVPLAHVRAARERLVVAFGSCSFDEPVSELTALGWMRGAEA